MLVDFQPDLDLHKSDRPNMIVSVTMTSYHLVSVTFTSNDV